MRTLLDGQTWDISLDEARVSHEERRRLLREHQPIAFEWREVWDEDLGEVTDKQVPLPAPVCQMCDEPWRKFGCATFRAVALVGVLEREEQKKARTISELTEALTPRFGVERLRERGNQRLSIRMEVDEYSLMQGGLAVIDGTLMQIRAQWLKWFKAVGDRRRILADQLYALTLDSDYYVWLTQEFDPCAISIKRPGAPWDDPAWLNPVTPSHVSTDDR